MSSVEFLREFVNERLTAAAEEIFGVFRKTIVQYEEEIDRQRRLLDIAWKPEIHLIRKELPLQHVCKEEEVLVDQQLCIEERNSSLDQQDPEPPQIKEEQEELCSSQEGEQLVLKRETDDFMLTPTYEESDHREPELNRDHQPLSHSSHVGESQDQTGGNHEDSTRDTEPQTRHESRSLSNNVHNSTWSQIHHNPHREGKEVKEAGEAHLGRSRKRGNPETWNVNIQKMRRMRGQSYLGRKNQEPGLKEARKMGMPCQSAACHKSTKFCCREVEDLKREEIFKYFWGKLDWKEREFFVKSLVDVSRVKRSRTRADKSRRSASIFCHFVVDGRRIRVCQRMFLSTLGIKQWCFLKWVGRRGEISDKTEKEDEDRRVGLR